MRLSSDVRQARSTVKQEFGIRCRAVVAKGRDRRNEVCSEAGDQKTTKLTASKTEVLETRCPACIPSTAVSTGPMCHTLGHSSTGHKLQSLHRHFYVIQP